MKTGKYGDTALVLSQSLDEHTSDNERSKVKTAGGSIENFNEYIKKRH